MKRQLLAMSDGALHEITGALASRCVRPIYQQHFRQIESTAQMRATLRAGRYAWPGGYPLYLMTAEGDALCFDCAHENYGKISQCLRTRWGSHSDHHDWNVTGCEVNWEDEQLECAHCNRLIESAYGDKS